MSSWWKRKPTPEVIAAEIQVYELNEARKIRKSIFNEVMESIEQLPLIEGIESIGRDLGKRHTK